jgi:hypothetical protein
MLINKRLIRKDEWESGHVNFSGRTELKSHLGYPIFRADILNPEPSEYAVFDAEHGGSSDNASGS